MRIYENHVSVICGLGNEYESHVQGSSENKAGFNSLQAWFFFLSGLIFSNVHFLNRSLHIYTIIIYSQSLIMVKEANGLIRVLLIARILSVGNLPLDWRSYFPSKITRFVFSVSTGKC